MTELDGLLILNAIEGLGNVGLKKLLDHFHSAKRILESSVQELSSAGIVTPSIAERIVRFRPDAYLNEENALLKKYGTSVITYQDECYPKSLKNLHDAPLILYVKGSLKKEIDLAIAIVGSRRASLYGLTTAEKLAISLSELGITIVSGMARGIDSAAHRGTLKARGTTVAVLGCGLSHVYPPENKKLEDEIVSSGGAVISEFSMKEPPIAHNFPRRNRIISGLALGVVVVEASNKSGALITADCALEQGKEVFAVPGQMNSPTSQGVHNLIKQGAKLISGVEDILEELEPHIKDHLKKSNKEKQESASIKESIDLPEDENKIYALMSDTAIHIDQLIEQSRFSIQQLMNILLKLELKKLIKQLPGKLFIRSDNQTSP